MLGFLYIHAILYDLLTGFVNYAVIDITLLGATRESVGVGSHATKPNDGYIPFMVRFKAWWEGLEPEAMIARVSDGDTGNSASSPSAAAIEVDVPDPEEQVLVWPESRLSFCRRLWGRQFDVVCPGQSEFSVELVRPMALNNQNSLLDLSAGLGGGSRKVHMELGVWVTGMERDAELAAHADEISNIKGVARQVPVSAYDPQTVAFKPASFDGALIREMLHELPLKSAFLRKVSEAIRPFGHIVITDLMLRDEEAAEDVNVKAWLTQEPENATPSVAGDYTQMLESMGFDVRVEKDESKTYTGQISRSWAEFVQGLSREDLTRDFVNQMMKEAEYWMARSRALESGALRLYRIHAIKDAEY